MPCLYGYLDVAPETPGFVTPLFHVAPGANLPVVQVISEKDEVRDFREFEPPTAAVGALQSDLVVEIGDPALWAFKDSSGKIHLGDAAKLRELSKPILDSAELEPWPLVRLDLQSFSQVTDVDAIVRAFDMLSDDEGRLAAEVWRDSEVLAPAVRRDVRNHDPALSAKLAGSGLFVLLTDNRLNVFMDDDLVPLFLGAPLDQTRLLLEGFGRSADVVARSFADLQTQAKTPLIWSISGIGGVARHVIGAKPFLGKPHTLGERLAERGVHAEGSLHLREDEGPAQSQFFGIAQCSEGQVEAAASELPLHPPGQFLRHLINVRPFSLHSDPPRKLSIRALPTIAADFDHIWIIANHRQRLNEGYRHQLSLSDAASRAVRGLLISILNHVDVISSVVREAAGAFPSLNLYGALRWRTGWSLEEAVPALLHVMLCEEALLHTAARIVVLSPVRAEAQLFTVRLGARHYDVQIHYAPQRGQVPQLIGWAFSVELAKRTPEEFTDYCISLMHGYHWDFRGRDEGGAALLFEDEGAVLRLWPITSKEALLALISEPSAYGPDGEVIAAQFPVPAAWMQRALDMQWSLVHHTLLPGWLHKEFGSGRFGDALQA